MVYSPSKYSVAPTEQNNRVSLPSITTMSPSKQRNEQEFAIPERYMSESKPPQSMLERD